MLTDWRTAPVDERLRAALGFLEKLTLDPANLNREDVAALHAAGLTDDAIEDLIYVCFVFSLMDRLADAFDFEMPNAHTNWQNTHAANLLGYRLLRLIGK